VTRITIRPPVKPILPEAVKSNTEKTGVLRHILPMDHLKQTSTAMWIPAPLYESLPYLYVIGGVLFISGTLYIGVTAPGASLYIACGLISIVYGAVIFAKRQAYRQNSPKPGSTEPA
jgi:hypothetical protein